MIVVDANVLVYAVDRDSPRHRTAKLWLEAALSGSETVGFSWIVLLAFLRLTTQSRLFRNPLTMEQAFDVVFSWLDQPSATVVHPGPRHAELLRSLLPAGSGNLVNDAHLAALALEHGATLCSADTDFGLFRGLKWVNPFAAKAR